MKPRCVEAPRVSWELMKLAEALCSGQWSMALPTALWTGLLASTFLVKFSWGEQRCIHSLHLFRNDDLKALGVDDSKKLTEEQREARKQGLYKDL